MELTAAADICKILSDPHRLAIMRALVDGEQCASELLKQFTISQPTLSHHMKAMVEAGLLTERKPGMSSCWFWTPSATRPTGRGWT